MGWEIHPQAEDINSYANNPELLAPLGMRPNPPSALVDSAIDSYCHDSGRFVFISNIFLLSLCPRWVWTAFNALFMAGLFLMIFKCLRFSDARAIRSSLIFLTGILALLFLPWHDNMFIECYMTPYIWGATLMVAIAYGCLLVADGIVISAISKIFLCLCAFIVGGWHEGISLCLFCGLAVLWLVTTRESRLRLIPPYLFLAAGIIANILAPGQFERIDDVGVTLNVVNWFQPYTITRGIWLWPHIVPMLLYIIVAAMSLCADYATAVGEIKRIWPRILSFNGVRLSRFITMQLLCLSMVVATLLLCLYFASARVAMPGLVMSLIGIASLFAHYQTKVFNKTSSRLIRGVLVSLSLVLSLNIILNLFVQRRLSGDHRRIEALLAESDDGQVFYDPMEWPHTGHYPWQWTVNQYYVDGVPLHFIFAHPSNKRHMPLRLIPTSLAQIPASESIDGITFIGKEIVSDREPEFASGPDSARTEIFPGEYPYLKINAMVKTASGREKIRFFEVIPFTTSYGTPDERTLYYFRPIWRSWEDVLDRAAEIQSVSPAKYW